VTKNILIISSSLFFKGLTVVTIRNAIILFHDYYFDSLLVISQRFLVIIRSH
jgi:hypothetical protein